MSNVQQNNGKDRATKLRPVGAKEPRSPSRSCGLCGKTKRLTRTECCGIWICDDESEYVPFSFSHNSCDRNHRRYTLCGYHRAERHKGDWTTCSACREGFETELYVWYGTNEYNFEKLPNPPAFEPTHCHQCGAVIPLGEGGYMKGPEGYSCAECSNAFVTRLMAGNARSKGAASTGKNIKAKARNRTAVRRTTKSKDSAAGSRRKPKTD